MSRVIFLYVSFLGLGAALWVKKIFGDQITFDQIMFHLVIGFEANDGANTFDYLSIFRYLVAWPFALTLIFALVIRWGEIIFNFNRNILYNSISFLVMALMIFNLNIYQFVISFYGEDVFSKLYVQPRIEDYKEPVSKRNIIIIYVESLEYAIRDMGKSNPLKPIDSIIGAEINGFYQAPGTGWSIAGMIASQCSLPLKPFYGNNASKFAGNKFLPRAQCLSDILDVYGYHQIFMVGPDLKFAGMDKFYSSHKFHEMYGRDELKQKLKMQNEFTGWGGGANDDVLLDAAYDIIKLHADSIQPFNLTIITTDNHAPNGIPSPNCTKDELDAGYVGTFTCTSKFISNFINKILNNDDFGKTDIVVMGDHLFMANKNQKKFFPDQRRIYFKYIRGKDKDVVFNQSEMTHFDVAPTILDGLGILVDRDRGFGLGRSLFSEKIDEHFLIDRINPGILNRSSTYDGFW